MAQVHTAMTEPTPNPKPTLRSAMMKSCVLRTSVVLIAKDNANRKTPSPTMIAKPSPGLSPLVSANTDLSICETPHARAKRQLSGRCRHCARQRVNAANKNKRLSIAGFAFERMNWSRSFVLRQNSFFAGTPNTAAHSPVTRQFYDGKSWKVFSLSARSAL